MKTRTLFLVLVCLVMLNVESFAQHATISGYLTDAASGEALIGATVREAVSGKGTASNRYGFYSLTLPKGRVSIVVSYIGYLTGEPCV